MKKMRNKKGFSLAEMMIVIAIIVILAGATAVGVVSWLNNAKNAQNNVLSNNGDNFENAARLAVETANGTAPVWIGESVTVNPVTTTKETEGTTTAKKEDPIDDPNPETTPATTPSTTPATTPATTPSQNGGGITKGCVNLPAGTVGANDFGVTGISESNGTVTINIQKDSGYKNTITIEKRGNDYILKISGDNRYILQIFKDSGQQNSYWPNLWDGSNHTYTLNSTQKAYLESTWGIKLQ